jgi:hypothetical protein
MERRLTCVCRKLGVRRGQVAVIEQRFAFGSLLAHVGAPLRGMRGKRTRRIPLLVSQHSISADLVVARSAAPSGGGEA